MAKEIYKSGNYVIAIDANGYQREFPIGKTVYSEKNGVLSIVEGQIEGQEINIELSDATNWTNDLAVPYDSTTIVTFLRQNTGFNSALGGSNAVIGDVLTWNGIRYVPEAVADSSNIGNSDLTIDVVGQRKLILGGALVSDKFSIRNSADTENLFEVKGDGSFAFKNSALYGDAYDNIVTNNRHYFNYNKTGTGGSIYAFAGNPNDYITRFHNTSNVLIETLRTSGNGAYKYYCNSSGQDVLAHIANNKATYYSYGWNIVGDATTGFKLINNANHKLSFWGVTPVVQQVLATGTGATVDDVISMLQTIGICKQL